MMSIIGLRRVAVIPACAGMAFLSSYSLGFSNDA